MEKDTEAERVRQRAREREREREREGQRERYIYIYSICGQYCFVLCGLISAAQRNEAEPDSSEE